MDEKNKLYFGDNLKILRDYVEDTSVDLIYLDPACPPRRACAGRALRD
jgi:DNA modification methylase